MGIYPGRTSRSPPPLVDVRRRTRHANSKGLGKRTKHKDGSKEWHNPRPKHPPQNQPTLQDGFFFFLNELHEKPQIPEKGVKARGALNAAHAEREQHETERTNRAFTEQVLTQPIPEGHTERITGGTVRPHLRMAARGRCRTVSPKKRDAEDQNQFRYQ